MHIWQGARLGNDWIREEITYEILRLQRVLRVGSDEERTIAQMQLNDYLELISNGEIR